MIKGNIKKYFAPSYNAGMEMKKLTELKPQEIIDSKQKLFQNTVSVEKASIDEEKGVIRGVVGSSGIIDRHGESINPEGWDLKNFKNNPVILWMHNSWLYIDHSKGLPVGRALNVTKQDGKLIFDIEFDLKDEFSKRIFDKYVGGFLNAFSVGFIPLELDNSGAFTYKKMELLELSCVVIPANPEAAVPASKALEEIGQIAEAKMFQEMHEKKDPEFENTLQTKFINVLTKNNISLEAAVCIAKELGEMVPEVKEAGTEEKAQAEVIIDGIKQLLAEVTVTKTIETEKIVNVDTKGIGEGAATLLLQVAKNAEKAKNKASATETFLKSLLNVKNSLEGGAK
jgi:HK97 family phage prohead protease